MCKQSFLGEGVHFKGVLPQCAPKHNTGLKRIAFSGH